MDALDRCFKPMTRTEKRQFAKAKEEEQLKKELNDPHRVRNMSSKFERMVEFNRKLVGLC
jgi:uncharacterized protein YlxW (UPF0749 family)